MAEAGSYEVIVSDDAREETAKALVRAQFPWAKWTQGPARGPAANRNSGARHATGEWIFFIDDDCVAGREWISAFRDAVSESVDLMEGQTRVPDATDDPFEAVVYNRTGGLYWSCNLAVRRERFLSLGGFDEDFLVAASEDSEFAHRFHARGYRSQFCRAALVSHPVRHMNWRGVWKRLCLVRWTALYRLKIDESLHLSDSPAMNLLRAWSGAIVDQLRITVQDIRTWNRRYWKSRLFWIGVRWVTFPVILPYYVYWAHRYHGELNARPHRGLPTDREPLESR
jgi:GT2 family glycosyltransferase